MTPTSKKYGTVEFVLEVPIESDKHRCRIAEDKLMARGMSQNFVDSIRWHTAKPTDEVDEPNEGMEFQLFEGRVLMEELND